MWFIKGAIGLVADTGRRRECWPRGEQEGEVGGGGNALHVLEGGNDCVSWNVQKRACDLSSTSGLAFRLRPVVVPLQGEGD